MMRETDGSHERDERTPERFEGTGYAPVRFPRARRELLPAAVEWWRARSDPERRPAFRLSELGTMPDEELADMTPAIARGCEISVRDGTVWGRPAGSDTPVPLLGTTPPELCVFNAMNGRWTIGEIAASVAADTGWPSGRAFAFTRGVFLHLVRLRVCAPTECD